MRHVSRIQLHCPETDFQNLSLEGKQYQSHQARPIPREEPVIQMILFVTRLMWIFENFFPGARGYIYALRMRIEHYDGVAILGKNAKPGRHLAVISSHDLGLVPLMRYNPIS